MVVFPRSLAHRVSDRWDKVIGGDYTHPPCPPLSQLIKLLEACYIASTSTEEGRYLPFNIVVCRAGEVSIDNVVRIIQARPLDPHQIRRLAPTVDLKKSAILVEWDKSNLSIVGLVDIGTSWYRARMGLSLRCASPHALIVQIERPGKLSVYQGSYRIAALADGVLDPPFGRDIDLFLHKACNEGMMGLDNAINYPEYEPEKEFIDFQFICLWNTYSAIANTISVSGHGGMCIILPDGALDRDLIRCKYATNSVVLREAFIRFVNARHLVGDHTELIEDGFFIPASFLIGAEWNMVELYEALVEATRFVAGLSGCDGALVLSSDLHLLGFGGEIRAELEAGTIVSEVKNEANRKYSQCDIEQFGMRHRSAIKFASRSHQSVVLAISQDGPVSAVWWQDDRVLVKKNVRLTNLNMPLA